MKSWKSLAISLVLIVLLGASFPYPDMGLYYYTNQDPTVVGVYAPQYQFLIRTDVPSIYYKSGAAITAWTKLGTGASTTVTCPGGEAITAIDASGTATCDPFASSAGASTLSQVTSTQLFSGSTICDVNLTSVGSKDWVLLSGGGGSWGTQGFNFNGVGTHKKGSMRLWNAISFQGNDAYDTVGFADPNFTMTDSAANTTTGTQTGAWNGNTANQGILIDVPLFAAESGTLTVCWSLASTAVSVAGNLSDNSATAVSETISNPSPGAGTRYQGKTIVTFVNGGYAGNRLRVTVAMLGSGIPFTSEFGISAVWMN